MQQIQRKPSQSFGFKVLGLLGVIASGLSIAACERAEPKPEKDVILQSSGHFAVGDKILHEAVLLVRNGGGVISVEIRKKQNQGKMASATIPGMTWGDLFADARGPLRAQLIGSVLEVGQPSELSRSLLMTEIEEEAMIVPQPSPVPSDAPAAESDAGVPSTDEVPSSPSGAQDLKNRIVIEETVLKSYENADRALRAFGVPGPEEKLAPEAVSGSFEFKGNRWVRYNAGLLERGMVGTLKVVLRDSRGGAVAEFIGKVTRDAVDPTASQVFELDGGPLAIGTSVVGEVGGSESLRKKKGFRTRTYPENAEEQGVIVFALPRGAGKIQLPGRSPKVFNFVPETDVTPPGGMGEIKGVTQTDTLVEATDLFSGEIRLPAVDFGTGGVTGQGVANVYYRLKLSIDQKKVNVTGRVAIQTELATADEKRTMDFTGVNNNVNLSLDW